MLPDEREDLAVIVAGAGAGARLAARLWAVLADALRLDGVGLEAAEVAGFHPTRSGPDRRPGGGALGARRRGRPGGVGRLRPRRPGRVPRGVARGAAGRAPPAATRPGPISRYPASDIDLAFVVDDERAGGRRRGDAATGGRRPARIGSGCSTSTGARNSGPGRRSLAYHLRLRALDRTLTDAEVAEVRRRAIDAVHRAHGAELRPERTRRGLTPSPAA